MFPANILTRFEQIFKSAPQLIVRAPGRINLIGEHTDYNGGYVLPAAIDKAIWFAVTPRSDNELHFHAFDLDENFTGHLDHLVFNTEQSWVNYLLGVCSEILHDGGKIGGINLVFGGDVPLGAGLSSSAAVESGMGRVLNELFQLGLSPMQMVLLAQRAENNFVGMQCGIMDMFASVMGRTGQVIRLDCRDLSYAYFPFDAPDYTLLLFNSGVKHALVDSEYNTRRQECETGAALIGVASLREASLTLLAAHRSQMSDQVYQRCKYVIEEISRVEAACESLKINDLVTFGQLMYATHQGLQYDYEVSCAELDFLVEATKTFNQRNPNAVLGARMMGGGFGGCSINLVHQSAVEALLGYIGPAFKAQFGHELVHYEVQLTDGVDVIKG
jgi:galactokinase